MLIVISPAKKLDFESLPQTDEFTMPDCLDEAEKLIDILKGYSIAELEQLMHISNNLAQLNRDRYHDWQQPFSLQNAKQAILTFKGDVYAGMNVESFSEQDLHFTQQHLRILSGLYGLLRPLDLMQPYRLEMGTRLENKQGANLYQFWGKRISELLNQQLAQLKTDSLINLASNEYFKSIQQDALQARIVTPVFKEQRKDGSFKVISIYAKKARGMMAAFIIKNQLKEVQQLKQFKQAGYAYNAELSSDDQWVFSREQD